MMRRAFLLAYLVASLCCAWRAWGQEPVTLTARVGQAFYLPLVIQRDERVPLSGLDAAVTVTPPGILRAEYASGPKRCLSALGARGLAVVCEPPRRIPGPPVQLVYSAVAPGVATITLTDCRIGEAAVSCPLPVMVEISK